MVSLLKILKALADENRLKIVELLLLHNPCVGAIAMHVGISEAAVSQHLKILKVCMRKTRPSAASAYKQQKRLMSAALSVVCMLVADRTRRGQLTLRIGTRGFGCIS